MDDCDTLGTTPETPLAQPRLLFLHVAKTAGTTLRRVIRRNYESEEIFDIGSETDKDVRRFLALPGPERARLHVLQGHMTFGLHGWLPQPTTYVTLLRHPIARVVSEYQFLCQRPEHPLHATVRVLSLGEFLQSGLTRQISNGQTRMLSGACRPDEPGLASWRPMTEADLDQARENLERDFCVVGLQERFEESVLLMARELGWRRRRFGRKNVTIRTTETTAEDRALIESLNPLDMRLYDWARRRFEETVRSAGWRFAAEHLLLRARNRVRGGDKRGERRPLDQFRS